ncbi:hypothetical protein N799_01555 [Lysobacter arseniciresistens ZS79]|uniref:Uncharacterized protein n=1 Tax=Lysobacter arseniciresistens ZS79 TaxID=913325 RepID=A0A0A0F2Z3_9GAMM|nr:hypothetical protein [Lysobacter arseniciresistens]KGM56870.1 hypothetical protein N799_01555 [Lysobacter arseniciresistens ZS79]
MAPPPDSPLRRHALGLWLGGVAVLGLLPFGMRAFDGGVFAPSVTAWLWLGGSIVVATVAAVLLVRATRH